MLEGLGMTRLGGPEGALLAGRDGDHRLYSAAPSAMPVTACAAAMACMREVDTPWAESLTRACASELAAVSVVNVWLRTWW